MKIFLTYFLKYHAALFIFSSIKETEECVKRTQALVISFFFPFSLFWKKNCMKGRQAITRSNNNEYCAAVPWVSGVQFTKIERLHVRVKFTTNGKHQIQAENFSE